MTTGNGNDTLTAPHVLDAIDTFCRVTVPDLAVALSPDYEGLIVLLQLLRRAQAQMAWAIETLEDEAVKCAPHKEFVVEGVGQVTVRTGTKRTAWQHDELFAAIIGRIADDPTILVDVDTGEKLPPVQTVERVVSLLREAVTPSWKLGGIRGTFGLDPGEYCSTNFGRKSLQLPAIADPFSE